LELSRRFYFEAVRPILDHSFPGLDHAAARIHFGSEVLGFDDEMSRDHYWGPRIQLFLPDLSRAAELNECLARELPTEFAGFPTHFGQTEEAGMVGMKAVASGPVDHRAETLVLRDYVRTWLGLDPLEGFTTIDWLVTPSQKLLEWTAGEMFYDSVGELTSLRELLAWYPHDVWLFVMAGHWHQISELEHLHGRAGLREDESGSRLLAAALVREVMRIGFLQERRYPPYPKWLGSAYAALARPETAALAAALREGDWRARESALVEAFELLARRHNELAVTEPVNAAGRQFWDRPIRVIGGERFYFALRAAITDPDLKAIEEPLGAVDSVADNAVVLTWPSVWRRLCGLYHRT
jgi:uncharacterized protein DUF4037